MLVKEYFNRLINQAQSLIEIFKDLPQDYLVVLSLTDKRDQFDINIDHEGQRVFIVMANPSLYATEKE